MSEDKKNTSVVAKAVDTDLTEVQLAKVAEFVEQGLPGLDKVDEFKTNKIIELYLSGKTYTEISNITRVNKTIILYLSSKYSLPVIKRDYLTEIESAMKSRVLDSKVVSQNFMLQLLHMWETKMGGKINKYLASGDDSITSEIDLKEVDKYLKTVEMLHAMNADPKAPRGPLVGINPGADGVTVKAVGNNSIEITSGLKEKTLKELANMRRAEEKENNKNQKKSDIIVETPEKQGDDINEND